MKVIVQNRATEYQDEGQGPVILILHGWGDSLRSFDQLTSLLIAGARVVRLDLPGFGGTPAPEIAWNIDNYGEFVGEFIRKLDLRISILIGHSFGGRITIKWISEGTLRAEKVVLMASAGFVKSRTLRNWTIWMAAKVGGFFTFLPPFVFWRNQIREKLYSRIGSDYLSTGQLRQTFLLTIAEDLTESAKRIKVPALLIWWADDTATPLADGKRFAQLIPNSDLQILEEAGHFVHQEKSEQVAALIKKLYV